MTLAKLQEHVRSKLNVSERTAVVDDIVLATVLSLGLYVSASGEVCDPRPKPVVNFPNQQNVRFSGRRRR